MTNDMKRMECIHYLDWHKVRTAMIALNWQWYDTGIPTAAQLQNKAAELLLSAHELSTTAASDYFVSTGGLKAGAFFSKKKNKVKGYTLSFVLDEWTVT